jgi:hypothetical protein
MRSLTHLNRLALVEERISEEKSAPIEPPEQIPAAAYPTDAIRQISEKK